MYRIFHPLLCYYPSQAGGPANTLYWLNNALAKKDYNVKILSSNFGIKDSKNLAIQSYYSEQKEVKFVDSKLSFIREGNSFLQESDIIQFSSIFFPPTLPLLIMAIGSKKKIIISPRGELYPAALSMKHFQKRLWLKIIRSFQNKIFFHATNVYEKQIIRREFPDAAGVDVIPNFIELPTKLCIEVNRSQILFIGRINPIKNIDILIRAISFLKKENVNLLIAGEARLDYEKDYFLQLKELVKKFKLQDNITFLGHIDREEKQKHIASSFALILPSKSENFGNVVIEALAQGTPVIASKNTPWDILEKTESGYWVEAEAEQLSAAIKKILVLDENKYALMRENAYNLCIEKFDISTNVHQWKSFYKKIIN